MMARKSVKQTAFYEQTYLQGPRIIKEPRRDVDFLKGFGMAVACIVREHDMPSLAAGIIADNGLSLSDFEGIGLDDFDLKPLRSLKKESAFR